MGPIPIFQAGGSFQVEFEFAFEVAFELADSDDG